jgi:aspartyl-tRNA(Asn)/glutamyl-tRNA(Gln) amidotransferase subunit B
MELRKSRGLSRLELMNSEDKYEPVIGLEVHAQMLTNSKVFCSCTTKFGNEPNSNVCPICLGMPGVLPVLNKEVVEFVLRIGLATHCKIASRSLFARKNYFYPDLPKGYQISQFEEPICTEGYVEIELEDGSRKRIGLTRIHMEEDAGKSIHDIDFDTLVDVNRCGVPLIEIVSEPDLRSPREAYLYLQRIRQLVRYLGICDGNMEEGSLRCDANVSVRAKGTEKFGTKTEVKNMNSFRNVERALSFEISRQIEILESGEEVEQETLLWDADQNVAMPMRTKEYAHDYRYFPEPDLVPVLVDEPWLERIRKGLPELPTERRDRFMKEYGLPRYDAEVLTIEKSIADYFEEACSLNGRKPEDQYKAVGNWVMGDVLRVVNERQISVSDFAISPQRLARMVKLIGDGVISGKIAKEVFEEMLTSSEEPQAIVERKGLLQLSDEGEIEKIVDHVLEKNAEQVQTYIAGKDTVFGFFVGQTMRMTKGKANPKTVNEILRKKLDSLRSNT